LCELTGANVEMVRKGIGSDKRIGMSFLYAGAGYGGSCFPKDVKALARSGEEHGIRMEIIEAVERVNEEQKEIVFKKLLSAFNGDLKGKTIAIWGLSFKPDTDDMREAPSLAVISKLIEAGAVVKAFDPVAMEESKRRVGDFVIYGKNIYDVAKDADGIALLTEWKQFRLPSWSKLKGLMKGNVVVDGRNIYDKVELEAEGFRYFGIGKNR
jgi:UDPglucose 6-dehydrogenase